MSPTGRRVRGYTSTLLKVPRAPGFKELARTLLGFIKPNRVLHLGGGTFGGGGGGLLSYSLYKVKP